MDAVDGESDTGNNCSAGIEVAVSARVEACTFDLDDGNDRAAGVAHANGTLYVGNDFPRKVFAYTTSGERDADSDFDLDDDNSSPNRIATGNGLVYVVDDFDGKVYAYSTSGERDVDADFDLATRRDNDGIAFADGGFYLIDSDGDRVLAYTVSGERDAAADFELHPYTSESVGLAHADARFFVVDRLDAKVYAYHTTGERDPGLDFELHPANEYPQGITYDGARFHVVDSHLDRMFIYPNRRHAPDAQPCFWEGNSTTRRIPENIPPGVDVGAPVTASGGDASPYTLGGDDAESFEIVAGTGQIRTREGVVYDYETKNRYLVEVGVGSDGDSPDMIDVTIHLDNLYASCGFGEFALRVVGGDGRLTVIWDPLPDPAERYARIQGYETEIRRGDAEPWNDRRTFLGRDIGGTVYANLDNDTEYQVRVRSINAERECGWSTPVSATPTGNFAPRDDSEHLDRFGPHPIGSTDRHYRLLVPGRCRHTVGGSDLDADCTYERTAPDAGRIFLEFDDPSKGSCEITLAYSSLTAGSFVDECFDAGVNTNVPFDRSLRMPELPDGGVDAEVPRAPRTQEEFDVFAWGRADLIPGIGFGCPPAFITCYFGSAYTIGRHAETGLPLYVLGDYSYENTGPSSGRLVFDGARGGVRDHPRVRAGRQHSRDHQRRRNGIRMARNAPSGPDPRCAIRPAAHTPFVVGGDRYRGRFFQRRRIPSQERVAAPVLSRHWKSDWRRIRTQLPAGLRESGPEPSGADLQLSTAGSTTLRRTRRNGKSAKAGAERHRVVLRADLHVGRRGRVFAQGCQGGPSPDHA